MVVTFPEYETVFENAVYVRDFLIFRDKGEPLLNKKVLIPIRYTEPSEDDVVAYLQKKAEEITGASRLVLLDGSRMTVGSNPLEEVLSAFPDQVKMDLRTGGRGIFQFIRDHTPAPNIKDGESHRQYLHVKYGVLPQSLIKTNQDAGKIENAEWFDVALSSDELKAAGFGEKFSMRLAYDHGLPKQEEISVLLKHGTRISKSLQIDKSYSLQDAQEVMDALYLALADEEEFMQLRNASQKVLEECSLPPLLELHQNLNRLAMKNARRGNSGH